MKRRLDVVLFLATLLSLVFPISAARAATRHAPVYASPRIRTWVPSNFDSLQSWAADARARFRAQRSDAIDSTTIVPFNRVATLAFRWLADLGLTRAHEIKAVEAAVDSLGFDTEMIDDPRMPQFILCIIRNPYRSSAHPMAFMYWFRGVRLYEQGVELLGGRDPVMAVWWEGEPEVPYEWALVDKQRGPGAHFFLFQMSADGGYWVPAQYIGKGPDLAGAIEAKFADINADGLPELVSYAEASPDRLFEPCTQCPKRLIENIYTERKEEGFSLLDSRIVPAPYSMFVLFIHLLIDHNRDAAARVLADPTMLDEALGLGWGTRTAPDTWKLEDAEGAGWPHWLQFRFRGPRGDEHFVVWFTQKDGRWIIQKWQHAQAPASTATKTR